MAKFLNPFPPLNLGINEEHELEHLGQTLVDECVALYAQHLQHAKGSNLVDPSRWKHVKSRDDVHVYQERPGHASRIPVGADSGSDLPMLLAVGTIVGDLDDVMYGVANPTLDSMRIKTSYVEDNLINAAVLASLVEPSVSDPFRCLSVKWAVKGRSSLIRQLVKDRDFVYLESTGIASLAHSGERIGYQLLHSVQFPQIGDAPGGETVRGNMSMCCVYRQVAPNVVQLFMRGYLDPAGGVYRAVVIKSAAEVMVSVWKNVYTAQLKKLAWAIRRRRQRRNTTHNEYHAAHGGAILGAVAANRDMCVVCSKRSMLGSRSTSCRLCFLPICRSCRIRKALSFFGPDRDLIQQRIAFCTRCFTKVVTTSAFTVSSDEILSKDSFRGYASGETRSGTSSSSPTGSLASYYSNASYDNRY